VPQNLNTVVFEGTDARVSIPAGWSEGGDGPAYLDEHEASPCRDQPAAGSTDL
jgi:hypothetical protein